MPTTEEAIVQLFALVAEALARATWALLNHDVTLGQAVIDDDQEIDERTAAAEGLIWAQIESEPPQPVELQRLVGVLLALSELERSADLAEHIAQRAVSNIGAEMTPVGRGIVQLMSEVAIEMWRSAAEAYSGGGVVDLHEADEELDDLHDRLTEEIASGSMSAPVSVQVTLIARFYERIGDHAVNLNRRIGALRV